MILKINRTFRRQSDRRGKIYIGALLLFFCLVLTGFNARAFADDPWVKLGRGASNLIFGYMEIPHQIVEIAYSHPVPVAAVGGLFKGLFYGTMRTCVGLYEIVTFLIPIPENYGQVMQPFPSAAPEPTAAGL